MEKKVDCKRKRSENWNEDDRMLLKELIRKRVKQIENKNTDTNTNQEKKKAWLAIEGSFNELCTGGQRNLIQLKTQWAATKIAARKEVAEHRKELLKTGGGSQPSEIPVNSNDISVWLPNEFVVDSNEFDSDFVLDQLSVEAVEEPIKESQIENDDIIVMDGTEILYETKIPEAIPKSTPKLKKKIQAKKNFTDTSIKKLADFDIECREELHKVQMEVEKKKLWNLQQEDELQKLQIEAEKKRLRNFDMEYEMTKAKKIFYENKSFGEHLTGEYRDKVNRFKKIPAITDHGFQMSESVAIFRHLSREKLVPEHWYPRKNLGRSRIDEFLEWRQRNMGLACTDYFQKKWLVPHLQKIRPNPNSVKATNKKQLDILLNAMQLNLGIACGWFKGSKEDLNRVCCNLEAELNAAGPPSKSIAEWKKVNIAEKQLEHTLNEFENLFLHSKKFMVGDNVSFADLMAICEIDQPKYIGYNTFANRSKLSRWYQTVREELGPFYKEVTNNFENQLKSAEKEHKEQVSMKQ